VRGWIAVLVALGALAGEGVAAAQTAREVFEKVNPAVVVIRAHGREVTAAGPTAFTETGSGVLVTTDGHVMTAAHVVQTLDEISVEFLGGETVTARVVASEPAADLALLQLDRVPPGALVASLADSSRVRVGDPVLVVGAPYGLGHSLSVGHVSARWPANTVYRAMPLADFFQTDAVINTGNSGGPMFDMAGRVIGIVSHNISRSGGSEGLGFVVTIDTARHLLLEQKSFWSGTEGLYLTDQLADLLNVPDRQTGWIVKTVAKGSPADLIGLRGATMMVTVAGHDVPLGGDTVLAVQGIPFSAANVARIRDALSRLASGDPFAVRILRAGDVLELTGRLP
jgi:S1-C subfamily serine protease